MEEDYLDNYEDPKFRVPKAAKKQIEMIIKDLAPSAFRLVWHTEGQGFKKGVGYPAVWFDSKKRISNGVLDDLERAGLRLQHRGVKWARVHKKDYDGNIRYNFYIDRRYMG